MPTPHISAQKGEFAEAVLLPGDPLRAKYIADTYLDDAKLITSVRNMLGYTGTYKGVRVSVMGTGMGVPSISIYATELIRFYDVKTLIRVGSCGSVMDNVNLGDLIVAMSAATDSNVYDVRQQNYRMTPVADYELLSTAVNKASAKGVPYHVGPVFSTDLFYHPDTTLFDMLERHQILGVEMETSGLYSLAAELKVQALTICTVSDEIRKDPAKPSGRTFKGMTSDERQTSLTAMMEVALETVYELANKTKSV
eukprot:GEMP01029922.1.p1 GENE.GEMP01029922.1~~GEMP01029922.1.p1  ORF type:complete len:253 (+),score=36.84 GEMP01029922.1:247-1005(+)